MVDPRKGLGYLSQPLWDQDREFSFQGHRPCLRKGNRLVGVPTTPKTGCVGQIPPTTHPTGQVLLTKKFP
jgi:hypothetical protein